VIKLQKGKLLSISLLTGLFLSLSTVSVVTDLKAVPKHKHIVTKKILTKKINKPPIQKIKPQKEWVTVRLSYYTNSISDCGKTDGITASGVSIKSGMCAAPKEYSFGTQFHLENGKVLEVQDTGGAIKIRNGVVWLDVFVPNASEEYIKSLGVQIMKAYIER
jgi:3D (Asp-Asp-Asp) domain-containing protein